MTNFNIQIHLSFITPEVTDLSKYTMKAKRSKPRSSKTKGGSQDLYKYILGSRMKPGKTLHNVEFYKGNGWLQTYMRAGDFDWLERKHDYVQWLFPNYFKSRFNKSSKELKFKEAQIFRTDKEIVQNFVNSYKMMLGFYGMEMYDNDTGALTRAENYKERYSQALIAKQHNHLRIWRILASLNINGFRRYAIELVKFLEVEIYGEVGVYESLLYENKHLRTSYKPRTKDCPLSCLIQVDPMSNWWKQGQH